MENEKKLTVGGLFATNTSANNISYHQQTGSLFSTYPQAATPTETSDHYPNDGEDCVGGFSFGNNKTKRNKTGEINSGQHFTSSTQPEAKKS